MIDPWSHRRSVNGFTFGLGPAGYDVRVANGRTVLPGQFALTSTLESFIMPDDLLAQVCDKSSWARRGLAVQNTIIEPGWRGYLTLELTNHGHHPIYLRAGTPIAQIIFMQLDQPTDMPYSGKYQDQEPGPQGPR